MDFDGKRSRLPKGCWEECSGSGNRNELSHNSAQNLPLVKIQPQILLPPLGYEQFHSAQSTARSSHCSAGVARASSQPQRHKRFFLMYFSRCLQIFPHQEGITNPQSSTWMMPLYPWLLLKDSFCLLVSDHEQETSVLGACGCERGETSGCLGSFIQNV